MASGHVNRARRPNTWLHRPALRREDSPCQLGAVHTWHKPTTSALQRFRLLSGLGDDLIVGGSGEDLVVGDGHY